jgi:hypothetical protein
MPGFSDLRFPAICSGLWYLLRTSLALAKREENAVLKFFIGQALAA